MKADEQGFEKLAGAKRTDISAEYLVVDEHYAHLFTFEEIETAPGRPLPSDDLF